MAFQLAPVSCALHVKGRSDREAIGEFEGRVIAIAMRDTDPVAGTAPEQVHAEGIDGWGSTYFLVADPRKGQPVWVPKSEVDSHDVD